jgi:hypothetical protein
LEQAVQVELQMLQEIQDKILFLVPLLQLAVAVAAEVLHMQHLLVVQVVEVLVLLQHQAQLAHQVKVTLAVQVLAIVAVEVAALVLLEVLVQILTILQEMAVQVLFLVLPVMQFNMQAVVADHVQTVL